MLDRADLGLWVVADGMGGHEAGEIASAMIVDKVGALPAQARLDRRMAAVVDALGGVNAALVELVARGERGHGRAIGSTVVALALGEERFAVCWAGDSRAYRLRGGSLEPLTRDHSLVGDLVRAGMLAPAEADSHPDASVITRAVGAAADLAVDRHEGDAAPGDLFLLASDGLTRVVSDPELAAVLGAMNPAQAVDRLVEMVLQRGAPDNVTVIIVRVA